MNTATASLNTLRAGVRYIRT